MDDHELRNLIDLAEKQRINLLRGIRSNYDADLTAEYQDATDPVAILALVAELQLARQSYLTLRRARQRTDRQGRQGL